MSLLHTVSIATAAAIAATLPSALPAAHTPADAATKPAATAAAATAQTATQAAVGLPAKAKYRPNGTRIKPHRNLFRAHPWAVYKGGHESSWPAYARATGKNKKLLANISLRAKATWFGGWTPDHKIEAKIRDYIKVSQGGNKNKLVQMTLFRMVPWEHEACRRLPTKAERASYKRWMHNVARAIGNTPTAIILQPDGPFALCAPGKSRVPSDLIRYSARLLSGLPRTEVYIEAGAADWPAPGRQGGVKAAADILVRAGIKHTRGFALNGTHYSSVVNEVNRAIGIRNELRRRGIPNKFAVINTATSGHPFVFGDYTGPDPDNAFVCPKRNTPKHVTCVTLGIPPTAGTGHPKWRLPARTAYLARNYVDAYVWFGRPWLYRQNDPYLLDRALQLARTTPFPLS